MNNQSIRISSIIKKFKRVEDSLINDDHHKIRVLVHLPKQSKQGRSQGILGVKNSSSMENFL